MPTCAVLLALAGCSTKPTPKNEAAGSPAPSTPAPFVLKSGDEYTIHGNELPHSAYWGTTCWAWSGTKLKKLKEADFPDDIRGGMQKVSLLQVVESSPIPVLRACETGDMVWLSNFDIAADHKKKTSDEIAAEIAERELRSLDEGGKQ